MDSPCLKIPDLQLFKLSVTLSDLKAMFLTSQGHYWWKPILTNYCDIDGSSREAGTTIRGKKLHLLHLLSIKHDMTLCWQLLHFQILGWTMHIYNASHSDIFIYNYLFVYITVCFQKTSFWLAATHLHAFAAWGCPSSKFFYIHLKVRLHLNYFH